MADIDSHLIFRLRGFEVQVNCDISRCSGEKQKNKWTPPSKDRI